MNDPTLKQRIQADMVAAMKAKDAKRLGVIRLLMAAIKQREVDERITLDDAQVLAVIDKMLKQRQDSISQFQQAGRTDLVEQETFEAEILQAYLPEPLSEAEISEAIQQAIATTNASGVKDMGRVMAELKPKLQGRADMTVVSNLVKQKISSL
ncbi:MAG: GatB/YqeY domain-containing protein [Gammaproteobacteria bacterium]